MINLLPDAHKREIRAARVNVLLLRYIILLIFAALFLAIAQFIVYTNLSSMEVTAEKTINENAEKESEFTEAKAEADKFRSELSSAKSILDSQVSYSKAVQVVSELLPQNTSIDSLKLDESAFGSPMELSIRLPNRQAALNTVSSFENSKFVSNFKRSNLSVDDAGNFTMPVSFTLSKEAAKR